ncbi:MAG: transporter, family, L-fucose permease [Gammaproteobacteria bacterium]|nr:transporter, family, L-fucose permease [Gammaproteobacteria bacterium]
MNNQSPNTLRAAFVAVTTLFFAWGFITAMIDPLIPSVRAIFNLTYTQSMLTQFAFFMSYGIVSLPGAALVARAGYGRSILIALVAMIVGCLFMPFATYVQRYELVLVALFIIGSGITVLQLAANPLAAVLGPPERSHFRLTFSQAFNSLGTVIAPYLGSMLLLRGGVFDTNGAAADEASRSASLHNIDTGFLAIAAMIALLLIFIWRFSGRLSRAAPPAAPAHDSVLHALQSRWALLGAAAIFLYVGAEVSIGSVMINFLHQPDVLNVSFERAGKLLALYWLGAMVGRFAGSALLTRFRATFLLAIAAAIAALLCLTVSQGAGVVAGGCAIAVGLVNSIMFPTIFTITLERSTASAAATSGLLCMAIIGGALLPRVAGLIADASTLHTVFFLPAAAYVAITVFAMSAARARVVDVGQPAGNVAH